MTSRAWVFTYNNPNGDLNTEFTDLRYTIWQLERGESGTYHFQGYAEFKKPIRLAACKRWLSSAHWEPRRGTPTQAKEYASKEDTRIAGPWEFGEQGGAQGKRTDLDEFREAVIRGEGDDTLLRDHIDVVAKYPKLAGTIRRAAATAAYASTTIENPSTWQKAALFIADGETSIRKVHWFVDTIGNTGKTHLAKHLITNYHAFYSIGGKHADIIYAYEGQSLVVFDFPRTAEEFVCYSVIEALKNGAVTISKYESRTFLFQTPKVFVFSNFEPDRNKLSADRWDVHYIYNNL